MKKPIKAIRKRIKLAVLDLEDETSKRRYQREPLSRLGELAKILANLETAEAAARSNLPHIPGLDYSQEK